jgi:hypothetical protein
MLTPLILHKFYPFDVHEKISFGLVPVLWILFLGVLIWWLMPRNKLVSESNFQEVVFHHKESDDKLGFMLTKENPEIAYWIPLIMQIAEFLKQLLAYAQ